MNHLRLRNMTCLCMTKGGHKQTEMDEMTGALQEALLVNTALTELVWD